MQIKVWEGASPLVLCQEAQGYEAGAGHLPGKRTPKPHQMQIKMWEVLCQDDQRRRYEPKSISPALSIACTRLCTFNLRRIADTWAFTVVSAISRV